MSMSQYKGAYQLLHFFHQVINVIIVETEKITLCHELHERIIQSMKVNRDDDPNMSILWMNLFVHDPQSTVIIC